jgi:hypothetical protein
VEALWTEQVECATALRDAAVESWRVHCELCEWFAGWSRQVMNQHMRAAADFERLRL